MANGNGNNVVQQMFETKERGAAWVFRAIFTVMIGLCTIVGWFAVDWMSEVKDGQKTLTKESAKAVESIKESEAATERSLGTLTQSVNDNIKMQSDAITRLQDEERDHEQRIRNLEGHH